MQNRDLNKKVKLKLNDHPSRYHPEKYAMTESERTKGWKHDKVPRKATCQEGVRESGKQNFEERGKAHGEQELYDGGRSGTRA